MKRDVAEYVALCNICQRVKSEHQRTIGMLPPLQVLESKWENIDMDFIMELPRTQSRYGSLWIIINRLTKVAHFMLVKTTYTRPQLA
jgi:hypothetical protein